jgi:hypothetical protein
MMKSAIKEEIGDDHDGLRDDAARFLRVPIAIRIYID